MKELIIRNIFEQDIVIAFDPSKPEDVIDFLLKNEAINLFNNRLRLEFDHNFFSKSNRFISHDRDMSQDTALLYANALEFFEEHQVSIPWETFINDTLKEFFKSKKRNYFYNLVYKSPVLKRSTSYHVFKSSIDYAFREAKIENLIQLFMDMWKNHLVNLLIDKDDSVLLDILDDQMRVEMIYVHNNKSFGSKTLDFNGEVPSSSSVIPNEALKDLFELVNIESNDLIEFYESHIGIDIESKNKIGWNRFHNKFNFRYDKLCSIYDLVELIDRSPHDSIPIYFGSYKVSDIMNIKPGDNFFLSSGFVGLINKDLDYLCYIGLEHDLKCFCSTSTGYFKPVLDYSGNLLHTDHLYDLIGRTDSIHAEIKSTKGVGKDGDGRIKSDERRPVFASVDL